MLDDDCLIAYRPLVFNFWDRISLREIVTRSTLNRTLIRIGPPVNNQCTPS